MDTGLFGEPNGDPCCLCPLVLVLAWKFFDATFNGGDMEVVDWGVVVVVVAVVVPLSIRLRRSNLYGRRL